MASGPFDLTGPRATTRTVTGGIGFSPGPGTMFRPCRNPHDVVFEKFVIEAAARGRIEVLVREHQGGMPGSQADIGRVGRHWLLGEIHQMHDVLRPRSHSGTLAGVVEL